MRFKKKITSFNDINNEISLKCENPKVWGIDEMAYS